MMSLGVEIEATVAKCGYLAVGPKTPDVIDTSVDTLKFKMIASRNSGHFIIH